MRRPGRRPDEGMWDMGRGAGSGRRRSVSASLEGRMFSDETCTYIYLFLTPLRVAWFQTDSFLSFLPLKSRMA